MKKIFVFTLVLSLLLLASCTNSPPGENPISSEGTSPVASIPSDLIGVEEAKRIALEKAGLSENDVRFDRTELDNENGIWVYEVEFETVTTEYDAEIRADNGEVIKWEIDNN